MADNGKPKVEPRCGAMGAKRLYVFVSQPDITVQELAESMQLIAFGLAGMVGKAPAEWCDTLWDSMQEGARRHWKSQELGKVSVVQQGRPGLTLPPGVRG